MAKASGMTVILPKRPPDDPHGALWILIQASDGTISYERRCARAGNDLAAEGSAYCKACEDALECDLVREAAARIAAYNRKRSPRYVRQSMRRWKIYGRYQHLKSYAATGREFKLGTERVRQIVLKCEREMRA